MTQDVKASATTKTSAMKPWYHPWRLFKLVVRLAIYLPLSLLVILALLLGTPFGAHIGVGLASKFVPGFSAEYQGGTLNRELTLAGISWFMPGIQLKAQSLSVRWQPSCLLTSGVCVKQLMLDGVDVTIDTAALPKSDAAEETPSGPLILPVTLALDSAEIRKVTVQLDDMRFGAELLTAGASWQKDGLWIEHLGSDGLLIKIPATAEENAGTASLPGKGSTGNAGGEDNPDSAWPLASLPEIRLPMDIHLRSALLKNSQLKIADRDDKFSLIQASADFEGSQLSITELIVHHPEASLELQGAAELLGNYPLTLKLVVETDSPSLMPELGRQQLALTASGTFDAFSAEIEATGSAELNMALEASLANPSIPFNLTLDARRLGWPIVQPEYQASNLKLSAKGDLNRQEANFSGTVQTPFHSPLGLSASLTNMQQIVSIDLLNIKGEPGDIQLTGSLKYANDLSWDANIAFKDLTPSAFILPAPSTAPETKPAKPNNVQVSTATGNGTLSKHDGKQTTMTPPDTHSPEPKQPNPLPAGTLDGRLRLTGNLANGWQLGISDTDIQGELDGYPVTVKGDVNINHEFFLSANHFVLSAMGAAIEVNGDVKKDWALNGVIRAPDLSLISPAVAGRFNADFTVSGAQQDPFINLDATGAEFKAGAISLEGLSIKGMYQPKASHEFALSIKGQQLSLGERKLSQVTIGAKGDLNAQRLRAETFGDLRLDTVLHAEINHKRQQINAVMSRFNLGSELGDWQLSKDLELSWDLGNSNGSINDACLIQDSNTLCLARPAKLGKIGDVTLSFRGAPGAIIDRLLPHNIDWQGDASLDAHLMWSPKRKPTGTLDLIFAPGKVLLTRPKGQIVDVTYEDLHLNATLDADALNTRIKFLSGRLASMESELSVKVTPDRTLAGFVRLDNIKLEALKEFLPQLDTLEGQITSNLKLGGSLMVPEVSGDLHLVKGAFSASANPTLISDVDMAVNFAGQRAQIKGDWQMGDGPGELSGNITWPEGQFSGDMLIKGNKLAIIVPPMALLDVSPDLKLVFDAKTMDVKGAVNIPTGHIKLVQLAEGGVAVSNDVVFDDSIAAAEQKSSPYGIIADLNIRVGDQVQIEGMGLKGKLDGTIRLRQQAFKPPLLFGNVKVLNGSYKFMGQTLKIPKGEVQFVGPPQLPNLNIEAIREIKEEDMVAGVRITGTGKAPEVTLFSNPSKEQAEILSYIIKGKGFDSNGSGDNNALMMGAALSLSSSLSGGAINSIGDTATSLVEKFGFSNVQLDANDEGRVAISGYIGEDLMVKYGVGVFNPGYEMTVRYYLLSQLYLETVSGTLGQSLDIYYNFDL